jgi:hypothetical protein
MKDNKTVPQVPFCSTVIQNSHHYTVSTLESLISDISKLQTDFALTLFKCA